MIRENYNKDLFGNPIIDESDNVYNTENQNQNRKDLSDKIETEFIIEIKCKDEKHQEEIFNKLTKENYICRVLTL